MSAHTPGPWRVRQLGHDTYVDAPSGLAVAQVLQHDERLQNAHLIAAATEMLAALRRAERVMTDADLDHEPADDEARLTLDAVRAAIAKAEATS